MVQKKVLKVALLGLGTVGTGVYKVLRNQETEMMHKLGCEVKIVKILVRNLEKAAKKVEDSSILTNDWESIVSDPQIDLVIELMGGLSPAKEYITQALEGGQACGDSKQGFSCCGRKGASRHGTGA